MKRNGNTITSSTAGLGSAGEEGARQEPAFSVDSSVVQIPSGLRSSSTSAEGEGSRLAPTLRAHAPVLAFDALYCGAIAVKNVIRIVFACGAVLMWHTVVEMTCAVARPYLLALIPYSETHACVQEYVTNTVTVTPAIRSSRIRSR